MDLQERAGAVALAPMTGTLSLLRRARMFHPEGAVYRARVETLPGPFAMLARRLEGPALARLSTAWWRGGKEWLDALGVGLRFGTDPGAKARAGDQDLLFATIRSPWTTPFAPFTTEQHDFLANDDYAVSPFDVAGVGRAKTVPRFLPSPQSATARESLLAASSTAAPRDVPPQPSRAATAFELLRQDESHPGCILRP